MREPSRACAVLGRFQERSCGASRPSRDTLAGLSGPDRSMSRAHEPNGKACAVSRASASLCVGHHCKDRVVEVPVTPRTRTAREATVGGDTRFRPTGTSRRRRRHLLGREARPPTDPLELGRGRREVFPGRRGQATAQTCRGASGFPLRGQVFVAVRTRAVRAPGDLGRDPRDWRFRPGAEHARQCPGPNSPAPGEISHEGLDRVLHAVKLPPAGGRSDCRVARGLP